MLPFLICKTKLLPMKKDKIQTKDKSKKEKSFYVTGDNLPALKPKAKRKPFKLPPLVPPVPCDCHLKHLTRVIIRYAPKSRKRLASTIAMSRTSLGTSGDLKRIRLRSIHLPKKVNKKESLTHNSEEFFKKLENQLKALNLGKSIKGKSKGDGSGTHRSKGDKDLNDGAENDLTQMDDDEGGGGEMKRRGKRRRKGRQGGSDRLTSAGLTAQAQQDPETQVAGIGDDSHNPSSRGSLAPSSAASSVVLPVISRAPARHTDSFLDEELLKFLHREVDEDAIQTEFDAKRRYVLQEALRTRPDRPPGPELQTLVRELKVPAVSLGDWLHVPRVFSRKNAQFALPIDANTLETMSPMQYAAKYVTLKKSKQLLYLTVLRKFRPEGYLMPVENIEEGLILMMGGILSAEQARQFSATMEWQRYEEPEHFSDDIKLTILDHGRRLNDAGDTAESEVKTLKYRTWCGLCAVCERVYGRFPPREKDPPEGMELSDFSMLETKMTLLKVHSGLAEVLNTIRTR